MATPNQFNAATGRALVAAQSRLVTIAKTRHAAVMSRAPRPSTFVRIVDGRIGAAEELVKVAGIIHYIYQRSQVGFERDPKETIARLDEIARFALDTLRSISPVASGLYRDSHKLFRNGYPVADLSSWKEGDEISITNYVDYSRILEVGDGKFRIPQNVYERAADIVEEKYGKDAKIEFTWRGLVETLQIAQNPSQRRGFGTRQAGLTRAHNKSFARYPTIVIRPIAVQQGSRLGSVIGAAAIVGAAGLLSSRMGSAESFSQSAARLDPPTIDL